MFLPPFMAAFLLVGFMRIFLNEMSIDIEDGCRLFALRDRVKADADILIINGHQVRTDMDLHENDHVSLIKRGERPTREQLEQLLVARHTPGVHEQVRNRHVGIAGVGGLGSQVALALARVGVGRLTIVDFDVVEPSNLNRQQYFIDQIGMPKVTALRDTLARVNPWTEVIVRQQKITAENLSGLFAEVDILVEALDAAEQKSMLSRGFLQAFPDKPLVAASGVAGYGPSNSILTRQMTDNLYLCGDGVSAAAPGSGLMAPRVGIAAHHQANMVLRLLLGLTNEESTERCN